MNFNFSLLALFVCVAGCAAGTANKNDLSSYRKVAMTQNENDRLSGITFDEHLTKSVVEQKLGRSNTFGPMNENVAYSLGIEKGLLLSFTDEAEPKLTRAIITQQTVGLNPVPQTLYNRLTKTLTRSCKDIKKSGMTPEELFEIWGPADGNFGSGIDFWQYWLENGHAAVVTFANGKATIRCD